MTGQMVAGYKGNAIRRRPSPQQGHALETLGHAIDYLMDSYVLPASAVGGTGDTAAAQLLQVLSMEICKRRLMALLCEVVSSSG
jgi:hypothetical protein